MKKKSTRTAQTSAKHINVDEMFEVTQNPRFLPDHPPKIELLVAFAIPDIP